MTIKSSIGPEILSCEVAGLFSDQPALREPGGQGGVSGRGVIYDLGCHLR